MVNGFIGKTNDRRSVISKLKIDNIELSNSEIIVNKMASFYASVGMSYAKRIPKSEVSTAMYLNNIERNSKSIYVTPTNELEVKNIIDKLASKNCSGWDGTSNRIVKHIKEEIVYPLTRLINKSLEFGIFPDSMKIAHVTPLYKSGSELLNTNYWPISLLPVLSKIFEKVMYSRVYNFLQSSNQLFKSQYGFCKGHSCENAVQELLSAITKGFDHKEYTAALFLNLSKAFDTLNHNILFQKLGLYGIRGLCLDWLKHYLLNRRLSVKCVVGEPSELSLSTEYPLEFGIPQGSCLGPLLFLVYCNDLPRNLSFCNSILFVDDTTLYKSHKNLRYLKWCIQEELNQLLDWYRANKLTLNINKSVCVLFNEKGKDVNFEIEIDNIQMKTMKCYKFLGIWLDNRLKWDHHVSKLVLKIKRNMHLLKSGRNMLNVHTKLIIYYAHIQSHITYGLSSWGNMICNTVINKLQNLQNKCKKLIFVNQHKSDKVLQICDLIKLENCKFGYKLINGMLPEKIIQCTACDAMGKSLVKSHCYNTRNKTTPNLPLCNSNSVPCKEHKLFNELPYSVKSANLLLSFINHCKNAITSSY